MQDRSNNQYVFNVTRDFNSGIEQIFNLLMYNVSGDFNTCFEEKTNKQKTTCVQHNQRLQRGNRADIQI